MSDWQQSFAKRLAGLRQSWARAFERTVEADILPAFQQLETFLNTNGFSVSTPRADGIVRSFKFALGEDVYVLVTFRLHGPVEVEASDEIFIAGNNELKPRSECVAIQSINATWAQRQFQSALDRFAEALEATAAEPVAEYA
jgi:hypothetical protein